MSYGKPLAKPGVSANFVTDLGSAPRLMTSTDACHKNLQKGARMTCKSPFKIPDLLVSYWQICYKLVCHWVKCRTAVGAGLTWDFELYERLRRRGFIK